MDSKIAYAISFCSYLVENTENIRSVILFGSVGRGGSDKESDIDIFVDTTSTKKTQINSIVKGFYSSQTCKAWNLKGVKNTISVITGDIEKDEWSGLKRSIISDGIVLYGKYKSTPEKLRHFVIFSYSNVKESKKRVNLHRKLFGYKIGKKVYNGAVSPDGIRHGSGSFSVPIENYKEIRDVFKELGITPKTIDIWID
ncbi:nucleotidyltransferase domain-containing protein [archaeon]|nr:nucleotidyltransferase domain-containing protein [archaeon]